jgi:hypothetical protein
MAAFIPGASPPLVNTPIRFISDYPFKEKYLFRPPSLRCGEWKKRKQFLKKAIAVSRDISPAIYAALQPV